MTRPWSTETNIKPCIRTAAIGGLLNKLGDGYGGSGLEVDYFNPRCTGVASLSGLSLSLWGSTAPSEARDDKPHDPLIMLHVAGVLLD